MTPKWSYSEIRNYWCKGYEQWSKAVLAYCNSVNEGFTDPLPSSEIKATAKSISRWTWKNFTQTGFRNYQSAAGKKGGKASKRPQSPDSERTLKPWEALGVSRATFYRKHKKCSLV